MTLAPNSVKKSRYALHQNCVVSDSSQIGLLHERPAYLDGLRPFTRTGVRGWLGDTMSPTSSALLGKPGLLFRTSCHVSNLICVILVSLLSIAWGKPIRKPIQRMPTGQTNDQSNRNGEFQILADGSQDLAALIALFTTRGVERHTIDYTRGPLPAATAPLSLLGLMGYVLALLKLSLGVEFCDRTGFSVSSLRSYAGVKRSEVTESDKVVDIQYLERSSHKSRSTRQDRPDNGTGTEIASCQGTTNAMELADRPPQEDIGSVQWKLVKTVHHTQESMPLIMEKRIVSTRDKRPNNGSFGIGMCKMPKSRGSALLAIILFTCCLAVAASLASFPVLIFTSEWTWTHSYAAAGIPLSVLLGGLPWCLVHITEHLPYRSCDWYRWDWKNDPSRLSGHADEPGHSLQRRNSFAYFVIDDHFYIFDCRSVTVSRMIFVRLASFCAAVSITVGYICQYIELRLASARKSGLWLAIQGFLAVVRIFAWVWAPSVPGFSKEMEIRWTDQRSNVFKDSLTELEITLCWVSMSGGPLDKQSLGPLLLREDRPEHPALNMPIWLVKSIDNLSLVDAFHLARNIHSGTLSTEDFSQLQVASVHWDISDLIFTRWLQLRCRTFGFEVRHVAGKRREGVAALICRIIKDRNGRFHMVPGIHLHVHHLDGTLPSEMIIFSRYPDIKTNIFCFPNSRLDGTEMMYRGSEELPKELTDIFQRFLESHCPRVADPLWAEMLPALTILGLLSASTDLA